MVLALSHRQHCFVWIGDWLLCSKLPSLTPFPSACRGGLNKPKGKNIQLLSKRMKYQ